MSGLLAPSPARQGFSRLRNAYATTPGTYKPGQLGTYSGTTLHSDHTFGPMVSYWILAILAGVMFWLDYLGAGKSAEYRTTYTLMDVEYDSWHWSGMIGLYSAAIGVAVVWACVFAWLTNVAGTKSAPPQFTPGVVNLLNIFGLVTIDLILAFNAGMMTGVDEVFQIAAYMLLSTICVVFMRVSHTTEPVTLLGAFACRAGAIIVLSLNVSLTDMIIDNRMKAGFIIYSVVVLFMDFMHILARIIRPFTEERQKSRGESRTVLSRLPKCYGEGSLKSWGHFLLDTFSSGTYPAVVPEQATNDGVEDAKYATWAGFLIAALHGAGFLGFCIPLFLDKINRYARLDFNVQGMFVWSRAYPLMSWFLPVLWGAPTALYLLQATVSGVARRWALSQYDKLSMPGTSLAIAVMDFAIASLLGPLYMVTAWQEHVFLGCLMAISALYILNIASQDWYYHLFAALGPLIPFLFVVIRADHISYSTLDKALIGLLFGLYALRSLALYVRTSTFGFDGKGTVDHHGQTWCLGDRRGFMAMVSFWVPFGQWLIAIVVSAIIIAPRSTYYDTKDAIEAALPTMITVA